MADEHDPQRDFTFPLTGQKIGSVVVGQRAPDDSHGRRRWICHCACGNTFLMRTSQITKHIGSPYWACSECSRAERASKGGHRTSEIRVRLMDSNTEYL